jgi:DNA-binding MarR family transcriptional regulator
VGYVLKQAAAALRAAMEDELRSLELTVTQYSCLELLSRQPGQSNADLARGAFVTRQSMNEVHRDLEDRGLTTRPSTVDRGRALPTHVTTKGSALLRGASATVADVERRMLGPLTAAGQAQLLADLKACVGALA